MGIFCLLLKLLIRTKLFVAVSPHSVKDMIVPLGFHELWRCCKLMERYESHMSLGFSHSNWAERRATVDSEKGKVEPRFSLGRNCFLHFFYVIHWWWIDQLLVVLSLVLKWVKNRNSAPCVILLFTFIFPVRLWERTSFLKSAGRV